MASQPHPDEIKDTETTNIADLFSQFGHHAGIIAGVGAMEAAEVEEGQDDAAINDELQDMANEMQEHKDRISNVTNSRQIDRDHPAIADLMAIDDSQVDFDQDLLVEVEQMCSTDPYIAMRFHDMVIKLGSDAIRKRAELVTEVKQLITFKLKDQEEINQHLQHAFDQSEAHKKRLEGWLTDKSATIGILQDRIKEMKVELDTRPKDFQVPDPTSDRDKKMKELAQKNFDLDKEDFPKDWVAMDGLLDKVVTKIQADFSNELSELKEKLAKAKELMRAVDDNRRQAYEDLLTERTLVGDTELKLNQEQVKNGKLEVSLSSKDAQSIEDRQKISEQGSEIASLKATLDGKGDIISRQDRQLQQLRTTETQQQTEISALRNEISSLKQQVATAAGQQDGMGVLSGLLNTEKESLRKSMEVVDRLQTEIRAKDIALGNANQLVDTQSAKIKEADSNLETQKASYTRLQHKNTGLETTLDLEKAEIAKLRSEASSLTAQRDEALKLNVQHQKSLKDAQDDLTRTKDKAREDKHHAVNDEIRRTAEVREELNSIRDVAVKAKSEHHVEIAKLNDRIRILENRESRHDTDYRDLLRIHDGHKELLDSTASKLKDAEDRYLLAMARAYDVSRDRAEESAQLRALQQENYKVTAERLEAVSENTETQKRHNDIKKVILYHGFGVDADIKLDLEELLSHLDQPFEVTPSALRSICETWQKTMVSDGERWIPIEIWLLSVTSIADISLKHLNGLVKTEPTFTQMAFLQEAVKNVAKLSSFTFEQNIFLLRALELFWKSAPRFGSQSLGGDKGRMVRSTVYGMTTKLVDSPLIRGYHDWLLELVSAVALRDLAACFISKLLRHDRFELSKDVFVFVDHGYVIIAKAGDPPFIAARSKLQVDIDDSGSRWDVWVEGYPLSTAPLKKSLDATEESMDLLVRVFKAI